MNLEQFRATRTECADLGAHPNFDADWFLDAEGKPAKVSGFVYADDCCIQRLDDGRFYLLIANTETVSSDLAELERTLWQWAVDEELF